MLVHEIHVLKEAASDLEIGKQFYDNNQPGIGDYFWDSLISDIESLFIYAGIHKTIQGFHCMYAKRFPYAIYYFIKDDEAFVVAVLPVKKDPLWIEESLLNRT